MLLGVVFHFAQVVAEAMSRRGQGPIYRASTVLSRNWRLRAGLASVGRISMLSDKGRAKGQLRGKSTEPATGTTISLSFHVSR